MKRKSPFDLGNRAKQKTYIIIVTQKLYMTWLENLEEQEPGHQGVAWVL